MTASQMLMVFAIGGGVLVGVGWLFERKKH
jgi:hypothetical protein